MTNDHDMVQPLTEHWMLGRSMPQASAPIPHWEASVPGTVAGALRKAGEPEPTYALDDYDWWFTRTIDLPPVEQDEEISLWLEGIATVADVYLGGEIISTGRSMFTPRHVDLGPFLRRQPGQTQLSIACRSLTSVLKHDVQIRRPRFRGHGIESQRLRAVRTTQLGRTHDRPTVPNVVGPYRPVWLLRHRVFVIESWCRNATLVNGQGLQRLTATLRPLNGVRLVAASLVATGPTGVHRCDATMGSGSDGRIHLTAQLVIEDVAPWMPHTHGEPHMYELRLEVELTNADGAFIAVVDDVPTGFRTITYDASSETGPGFAVCGIPMFCRGAVWTPADPIGLASSQNSIAERLTHLRDSGLNMIRIPGHTLWETDAFHRVCDQLGMLLWQDLMLSRLDYPTDDRAFRELLETEVRTQLSRVVRHPSTAIVCGGDEVQQQPAMLGLSPALGQETFTRQTLPSIVESLSPGLPVIPATPAGGDMPFRVSTGLSHYFGIGAYRRPLTDARLSGVRFASACLAFSNVSSPATVARQGQEDPLLADPNSASWEAAVPRDASASWNFQHTREHYMRLIFGIEPDDLRQSDIDQYLQLSRLVTGEVMAAAIGEWRRSESPCQGALVLQAADLIAGAGFGLLDAFGSPKPALAVLRRACLPRAVWITDEGLNGLDVHVANDLPEEFPCTLRVSAYRADGIQTDQASQEVIVPPRDVIQVGFEELLGRFIDVNWVYQFGHQHHTLAIASVHVDDDEMPLLQHFHHIGPRFFDSGTPFTPTIDCHVKSQDNRLKAVVSAPHSICGVVVDAIGFHADDAWFELEPHYPREVVLQPVSGHVDQPLITVTAIGMEHPLTIRYLAQSDARVERGQRLAKP